MRLLLAAFLKGCIAGCVLFAAGYAVFMATGVRPRQTAQAQVAETPTPTAEERMTVLVAQFEEQLFRHEDEQTFLLGAMGNAMEPFTHSLLEMEQVAQSLSATDATQRCLWAQGMWESLLPVNPYLSIVDARQFMEGTGCKAVLGPQSIY